MSSPLGARYRSPLGAFYRSPLGAFGRPGCPLLQIVLAGVDAAACPNWSLSVDGTHALTSVTSADSDICAYQTGVLTGTFNGSPATLRLAVQYRKSTGKLIDIADSGTLNRLFAWTGSVDLDTSVSNTLAFCGGLVSNTGGTAAVERV